MWNSQFLSLIELSIFFLEHVFLFRDHTAIASVLPVRYQGSIQRYARDSKTGVRLSAIVLYVYATLKPDYFTPSLIPALNNRLSRGWTERVSVRNVIRHAHRFCAKQPLILYKIEFLFIPWVGQILSLEWSQERTVLKTSQKFFFNVLCVSRLCIKMTPMWPFLDRATSLNPVSLASLTTTDTKGTEFKSN